MTRVASVAWAFGAPFRAFLIGAIRVYQATLSGLVGGQCRFFPTCSGYAEEAIRARGAFRGSLLALWRILRCGPFTAGGVDHPPAERVSPATRYEPVAPKGLAS
jgi:uncharacterized protein